MIITKRDPGFLITNNVKERVRIDLYIYNMLVLIDDHYSKIKHDHLIDWIEYLHERT